MHKRLSAADAAQIRLLASEGVSRPELAERFGVTREHVGQILLEQSHATHQVPRDWGDIDRLLGLTTKQISARRGVSDRTTAKRMRDAGAELVNGRWVRGQE